MFCSNLVQNKENSTKRLWCVNITSFFLENTIILMFIEFLCMHSNVSGSHYVAGILPFVGRVGVPRMQNEMEKLQGSMAMA